MDTDGLEQFVKRRRVQLYPSLKACAEAAGIAPSHLSQIEKGKIGVPNADVRRRLARALSVQHIDLLVALLVAAGELTADEVSPSPRLALPAKKAAFIRVIEEANLTDDDLDYHLRRVAEDSAVNLRTQRRALPMQSAARQADGRAVVRAIAEDPASDEGYRPEPQDKP